MLSSIDPLVSLLLKSNNSGVVFIHGRPMNKRQTGWVAGLPSFQAVPSFQVQSSPLQAKSGGLLASLPPLDLVHRYPDDISCGALARDDQCG